MRKILKWHPPCPKKGLPWCKHHWSLLWAVDSHPILAKRICASIPPPMCAPIAMTWSQLSHKTCNIDCMEEWQPKDVKGWNLSSTQIFCRELLTYILYKYLTLHHSKISNPTPQFSWDLEIPLLSCARSPQPYLQKEAGGRTSEVVSTHCLRLCLRRVTHTKSHMWNTLYLLAFYKSFIMEGCSSLFYGENYIFYIDSFLISPRSSKKIIKFDPKMSEHDKEMKQWE